MLALLLLGPAHASAQVGYRAEARYGYRGLVLGETGLAEISAILAEPVTCVALRRDAPAPDAPEEIVCQSASHLASPQRPWLYFLDGRLRAVHVLLPRDKVLEIVSAQLAMIFPGPGESIRLDDGRRVWRSRSDLPVIAVAAEVRVRVGEALRLAVVMSDRRVSWPGDMPVP